MPPTDADFAVVNAGPAATVASETVCESAPTTGPLGGVPVTRAVLRTVPESTSACVTVYVAVPTTWAPGARVPAVPGQVRAIALRPACGSATATPVSVTFPALRAVNVYVMTLPTAPFPCV